MNEGEIDALLRALRDADCMLWGDTEGFCVLALGDAPPSAELMAKVVAAQGPLVRYLALRVKRARDRGDLRERFERPLS
jgi:hypothetical protein